MPWGDPFPNTSLADALEIAMRQTPGFPPSSPALIAQIYDRDVAAAVKLTLMTAYPDEHPVFLVHGAGTDAEIVEELPLHEIDKARISGCSARYTFRRSHRRLPLRLSRR